jgi:hypothetical protein
MKVARKQEFDDIYAKMRGWNPAERPSDAMMRVHSLVNRITYKRGSKLTVMPDILSDMSMTGILRLRLMLMVTDINPPYSEKPLYFEDAVPITDIIGRSDEYILKGLIYSFIMRAEEHEAQEWLKFCGEHVIDPHPSDPFEDEFWKHHRKMHSARL